MDRSEIQNALTQFVNQATEQGADGSDIIWAMEMVKLDILLSDFEGEEGESDDLDLPEDPDDDDQSLTE